MTYRDPRSWVWAEALELLRGAEKLQRRFFQIGAVEAPGWEPPVDLYETGDGLTLCVGLPGVAADELEVSLESRTVVDSRETSSSSAATPGSPTQSVSPSPVS